MSGARSTGQSTADPDGMHPDHRLVLQMLDDAPMSRMHYVVWMLATGGTLLDGVSVFMLGLAIPLLTVDLALTSIEVGLLGGALVSGAIVGASIGGRLGDSYGRRTVFILDMVVVFAAALVGSLGRTPLILIVAQAAVGVGVGMDFPVGSSYVAECMPHRRRTRMMVATISAQAVGMVTAAVIAVALLHFAGSTHAWRLLFVAQAVIAAAFAISRLGMPESPRWLMSRGENRKALEQLARLVPVDRSQVADVGARLGDTQARVSRLSTQERRGGLAVLFHRHYLRRTLLVTVPWFFMDIATYGVGLFTAVILGAMHLGGHSGSLSQIEDLAAGTGGIDVFLIVGFAVGAWAVGRFGRIRMQIIGFAGMVIGLLVLASSTLGGGGDTVLVFAGFTVFNLSMNAGPNSTTYILPAELFPTHVRATAAGFAASTAKVGATVGVFLVPLIKSRLGITTLLVMMAVVAAAGLGTTIAFRVEGTGLTLEQHQSPDLVR